MKLFGECKIEKCDSRHVLSKQLDFGENIPKSGLIKYKIVNVEDVSIFSVNIVEHISVDGEATKCDTDLETIESELSTALGKQKRSVDEVNVGDCVALQDTSSSNETIFKRCRVTKIVKKGQVTNLPSTVIVKFLDLGGEKRVSVGDLYHLPEKFKKIPPLGNLKLNNNIRFDIRVIKNISKTFQLVKFTSQTWFLLMATNTTALIPNRKLSTF